MSIITKLESIMSRNWLQEPTDLESGKKWLADILLIFCTLAIPPALLFSLPLFLQEKRFGLILIDIMLVLTIILMVFFRNLRMKIRGYIVLTMIFLFSTSFFIALGPHYARPGWLVMSAVLAALFFNFRTVFTIVFLNAAMLMAIYWILGVENKAWASTFAAPFSHWMMFVVNISVISLISSIPLSFLLKRLDTALKYQQETQSKIKLEAKKVEIAYRQLQAETVERSRAETSLRDREELLSKLETSFPDVIVQTDLNKKITFINNLGVKLAGFDHAQQIVGRSFLDFVVPEDIPRISENHQKMFDQSLGPIEYDFITQDGRRITLETKGEVLRHADGRPYGTVNICRDVTNHKQAEKALQKSEERLRQLIESANDWIWEVNRKGFYTYVSPRCQGLFGYEPEEMIGKTPYDFMPPEEAERVRPLFLSYVREKKPFYWMESLHRHKNGRGVILETNGVPVMDEEGRLKGYRGMDRDITERKRAKEALRESEERYRNILESIDEGYYEVDYSGNLIFFNDSLCDLLGYSREELMGMNNRQFADGGNAAKLYQAFNQVYRTGMPVTSFEVQVIRKDGTAGFGEISVSPISDKEGVIIGFRGIARNITDRKRAEEEREKLMAQLRQAQKMEAIGTLAGGIAHDFNNVLTAIIGNAELALINISDKNPLHPYLMQVHQSARRAADLVKQILTFSRQKSHEIELIQPSSIVKETLKMLRSSLPSTIEIRQTIEDNQGLIMADPTQIHQILMNLCTNAAHAMRERGGLLDVCLANIHIIAEEAHHYAGLASGPYIHLTVSDTGHGIDPLVIEHIFDPYFTTKKIGEGTGLGLAVVYGIIKKSKGDIKVTSEPGKGSLFEVFLPRVDYVANEPQADLKETIPGGKERILLVDDEKDLVVIIQRMLSDLGYQVTSRFNSLEALEVFKTSPNEFDIIITDMTMPHLTGVALVQKIKENRPDIPIILCTGYNEMIDEVKAEELGIQAFLMKPIERQVLAGMVRKLLDQRVSSDLSRPLYEGSRQNGAPI
jgi:PAS domain S-box-containing protein